MKKFEDCSFWNNSNDIIKTVKFDPNKEFKELDNEMYEISEKIYQMFLASERNAYDVYLD